MIKKWILIHNNFTLLNYDLGLYVTHVGITDYFTCIDRTLVQIETCISILQFVWIYSLDIYLD